MIVPEILGEEGVKGSVAVVSDTHVAPLYGDAVLDDELKQVVGKLESME